MRRARHVETAAGLMLLVLCGSARCGALAQAPAVPPGRPQLAAPVAADGRQTVLTDTEHLLQLARELKATVGRTRRDELSIQVIREADEIEKLAKSVKARIH